jgi:hypothetical protein
MIPITSSSIICLAFMQPIYKGQLQRLLLNLCAHSETRISLVKILMDLLMLDVRRSAGSFSIVEPPYRLYGCQTMLCIHVLSLLMVRILN